MSCPPLAWRRRYLSAFAALVTLLTLLASLQACSGASPAPGEEVSATSLSAPPITAEINQFRDNYSKRIIEIQLTNTTPEPVTVLAASLHSELFSSGIDWRTTAGGIELPPNQTKSLPAQLPEASCPETGVGTGMAPSSADNRLTLRISTRPTTYGSAPLTPADPYGVLARNNGELCLDKAVDEITEFQPSPELTVSADGSTAVVRVLVHPRPATEKQGVLIIERIDGTTLIAADPVRPWPAGVQVRAGGPPEELSLSIRPARCDPHAVAEDKVGTLLPFHITVAGRTGILKINAGDVLRGRIHDFVTAACRPH